MSIPLSFGEETAVMDPATGKYVIVRVTAIDNGRVTISVDAPPDVPVTKEGEPEPSTILH
jgi:hypothetical protein